MPVTAHKDTERLSALHRLRLLDMTPEPAFERLRSDPQALPASCLLHQHPQERVIGDLGRRPVRPVRLSALGVTNALAPDRRQLRRRALQAVSGIDSATAMFEKGGERPCALRPEPELRASSGWSGFRTPKVHRCWRIDWRATSRAGLGARPGATNLKVLVRGSLAA